MQQSTKVLQMICDEIIGIWQLWHNDETEWSNK